MATSVVAPDFNSLVSQADYVVRAEIAGIEETDLEITFENGILIISGNRPDLSERRAYHQMEIHFGKFSTAIGVPGPIDLENSTAEYKDGFLIVRLPKAKPTDVKIEGS